MYCTDEARILKYCTGSCVFIVEFQALKPTRTDTLASHTRDDALLGP